MGKLNEIYSHASETELIYSEYRDKVFHYLKSRTGNQQIAEDLLSQVFLKIHEQFSRYDSTKASLSTWIYTVTRNTLNDHLRRQRRIAFDEYEEALKNVADGEMEAVDQVIREEQLNILASSLKMLPAREREIIVLRYYYDKTAKEVAGLMGLSHENVRYLQSKAIAKLRNLMEKQ